MLQQPRLLFGTSRAISKALDQCARYARIHNPVLILGEPGTGKTVLAEHIHQLSGRSGRFVKESAARIPEHIEVSHFCGHARGAFTGADREQIGIIEAAHRGTFFLDELGDASFKVQQLLRQFLDDGSVTRVGEERARPVEVRFIAATNADLDGLADAGDFRRDLRDRFGFFAIRLPSLADRRDEVLRLVDFFLERDFRKMGLEERPVLSPAVRACLPEAPWRGNVRELELLCAYLVVHATPGRPIELADLPEEFVAGLGGVLQVRYDRSADDSVRRALAEADGNKSEAARRLGLSRQQLYRLLKPTKSARA